MVPRVLRSASLDLSLKRPSKEVTAARPVILPGASLRAGATAPGVPAPAVCPGNSEGQEKPLGLSLVSLTFFCFFAVVFAAYWLVPNNALQKWLLLVASYVFYAFFDYRFCFLLFGASLVGFVLGRRLTSATRTGTRKALLITGLTVNLLLLGTFKYFDFFSSGATSLLSHLGFKVDHHAEAIAAGRHQFLPLQDPQLSHRHLPWRKARRRCSTSLSTSPSSRSCCPGR